jgi:arylsulfatase A-like enzyme
MITVDDASVGDLAVMPRVRRLIAERGTTVRQAVAPTPICVPARASLLTGQYAHNHGALTISGDGGGFAAFGNDEETLPVWLQRAGYDTMFVGKYLNGYGEQSSADYVPPGWTDWKGTVDPATYNFEHPELNDNGDVRRVDEYSSDLFSDLTVQLVSDPARERRPWYLWVNYVAPHHGGPDEPDDPAEVYPDDPDPIKTTVPAARHRDMFADTGFPDKPNMFEQDTSDKPRISPVHRVWEGDRKAELLEAYQQRLESLQAVDEAVGRTVRTLRRTGQLADTVVIFASDNGYAVGEHNLFGKLWHYRETNGIPLVLAGPGVPRDHVSDTPVTNPDLATTIAALARARPTRPQDGVDVLPWLRSRADARVIPLEAYPVMGGRTPLYVGVRVGRWTYVRWRTGAEELYDRSVDPYEMDSVARSPDYRAKRRELRALTARYLHCRGQTCPRDFYRDAGHPR